MFSASSVYHDRVTLEMATPYHRGFVDALKTHIPSSHRSWEPGSKTWFVEAPYDGIALRILQQFFPDAHIGDKPVVRPGATSFTNCGCDADHKVLSVCQTAPPEVVRAAYRALARENHPDRGGDHATMQRLNEAVERIESGVR